VKAGGTTLSTSDAARPLPMILFGIARPGSPLLPVRWPADDRPQTLPGRFNASLDVVAEPFTAYNVVGVVRGTDATLSSSYVAFGAHYDHIGIQLPVAGDSIANGADDDGSGSVVLLAVARALKANPLRRSALFVWHVGEEKGLLGSEYFTEHPTVPLISIVAQFNADMVGRNGRDSLFIVGPRAAPQRQSARLGAIVDSVNMRLASPFTLDRTWDDPNHPEHIYERSDHFSYAKRGIPIVFFTSGLHPQYHDVDDEVDRIDFDKLARVAALIEQAGRAVGMSPNRPR
jgi:Zn-dependent M28 family amino/carboxypeptidase